MMSLKVIIGYLIISSLVVIGFLYIFSFGNYNTALIHINGEIKSSDQIVDDLKNANDNPSIKGIIIEINSPGGYVVPSKRIAEEVKSIDKPTVCILDDVAASGAYWVASSCDYIIADNFTIVGSIGASGSYLEFSDLMKKYGINYVRIVSGNEKDIGSPYIKPTKNETKQLQNMVDEIRDSFVKEVSQNRNLSYAYVSNISNGRVFLGEYAIKLKLIDKIGNMDDAKEYIKEKTGIRKIKIKDYKHINLMDILASNVGKQIANDFIENSLSIKT